MTRRQGPLSKRPLSPNIHVFTNLEGLRTLSFVLLGFYGGAHDIGWLTKSWGSWWQIQPLALLLFPGGQGRDRKFQLSNHNAHSPGTSPILRCGSQRYVINRAEDTCVTLITSEIPKLLGALCQKQR